MERIEDLIGYTFKDKTLLETALTHSSYANENRKSGAICNERLEFLGDSVLGTAVAEYLYVKYPHLPEGDMTRLRAELVCEQSLVHVGMQLELGQRLRLGRGEELSGGRTRTSIIADAVEALIAAVYLEGGREAADYIVHKYILSRFESGAFAPARDYKTALQELVQRTPNQQLVYAHVGDIGPDHCKTFYVDVCLNGEKISSGSGRSKKEAEQAAADAALKVLSE